MFLREIFLLTNLTKQNTFQCHDTHAHSIQFSVSRAVNRWEISILSQVSNYFIKQRGWGVGVLYIHVCLSLHDLFVSSRFICLFTIYLSLHDLFVSSRFICLWHRGKLYQHVSLQIWSRNASLFVSCVFFY